jgi:hypothetical protein
VVTIASWSDFGDMMALLLSEVREKPAEWNARQVTPWV